MIAILGGMLLLEIVLTIWHGRYLAKSAERLDVNDRVIILQNRRIEDVIKETNVLMREELLRRT